MLQNQRGQSAGQRKPMRAVRFPFSRPCRDAIAEGNCRPGLNYFTSRRILAELSP